MGRYNLAPQRVHRSVTRLLDVGDLQKLPKWYGAVNDFPPSERLVRPPLQQAGLRKSRSSRMFRPVEIKYPEDGMREEFYGDHPWELARPRSVVEDDGKDHMVQDWSEIHPRSSRIDSQNAVSYAPLNGERAVQRQLWLMRNKGYTKQEAYDKARKEFYKLREAEEIQRRVAKEEALYYGATFGKSAIDVGLELEDKEFEDWKVWAKEEAERNRLTAESMYTGGADNDDDDFNIGGSSRGYDEDQGDDQQGGIEQGDGQNGDEDILEDDLLTEIMGPSEGER